MQVALVGLLKAVERFDPDRGLQFSTFATPTILGELKRHFRDRGWAIRVPRGVQDLHLQLGRIIAALGQERGRSPTPAEVAEHAGVSEEEVLEAMEAGSLYRLASLDQPAFGDDVDESGLGRAWATTIPGSSRSSIAPSSTTCSERCPTASVASWSFAFSRA